MKKRLSGFETKLKSLMKDIAGKERHELEREILHLAASFEIHKEIKDAKALHECFSILIHRITQVLDVEIASLMMVDEKEKEVFLKVAKMLKFDAKYKSIPIIMLTARVQESDEKLGYECGADAYITKPFEPKMLLEKISLLLK